jgi:hypothetical protein
MKFSLKESNILFFIILNIFAFETQAQDSLDTEVKIKIISTEETLASGLKYIKSNDIRKYPDLKKAYFHVLNNLMTTVSIAEQRRKWEIVNGLTEELNGLEIEVLFERFANAEDEIKEAISMTIWQKSAKLKNKSDIGMAFLSEIKERAEEAVESNIHDSISAFFLIEGVTQLIVNDESASGVYFMISEPEETVDLNEDGDLVTSFDFSPLSYLSDYYSQDFSENFLAGIINGMFTVRNGSSKPPLKQSDIKLMVTGHLQRDSFLINNSGREVVFYIVSTSGSLFKILLKPGSQHGFIFNNNSQVMRIRNEDGREFEIKPYKKYHFEKNQ